MPQGSFAQRFDRIRSARRTRVLGRREGQTRTARLPFDRDATRGVTSSASRPAMATGPSEGELVVNKWSCVLALAGVAVIAAPNAFAQSADASATATSSGAASSGTAGASGGGATGAAVADNARMNAAAANPDNLPANDPNRMLMRDSGATYSLGWRVWYHAVPTFIVGLFAKVEPGWGGGGGVVTGPEFVYRNGAVDIVLGVQYSGYYADYAHIRGLNEPVSATEQIKVDLWSIQVTSHFLYGIRANRFFEFQIGAGIGAGGMTGSLNRYQAHQAGTPSGWAACAPVGQSMVVGAIPAGPVEPCNTNVNGHFAANVDAQGRGTGGYSENNWVQTGGGYVPLILPWLSLPHMAFHIRPHRHFDIRLEGGFSLIGFYGGATAHAVF